MSKTQYVVRFNTTGIEPASDTFELPPEGGYRAKIMKMERDPANAEKRPGEYNSKFTIKLNEQGLPQMERNMWVSEPVAVNPNIPEHKKAADSGAKHFVALAISLGVSKEKLAAGLDLALTPADVEGKDVFVQVKHEVAKEKNPRTGLPYINANITRFIDATEYAADKAIDHKGQLSIAQQQNAKGASAVGANGSAGAASTPAKPASEGVNLGSILGGGR